MSEVIQEMLPPSAARSALIPAAPKAVDPPPSVAAKTLSPHYIRTTKPCVIVTRDRVVIKDNRQLTSQDIAFVREAAINMTIAANRHEEYDRIREIRKRMKDYLKGRAKFQ